MESAELEKEKCIVSYFLKRNILLSSDIVKELQPKQAKELQKKLEKNTNQDFLILNKDVQKFIPETEKLEVNWHDWEKALALLEKTNNNKPYQVFLNYIKNSLEKQETKPQKENDQVKIIISHPNDPKKRGIEDFIQYFNIKYKQLEKILRQRQELQNITSIVRIQNKKDKENLCIIGMVKEINTTKNNNIMLNLEDPTGSIKVLVNKNRPELLNAAKTIQDIIVCTTNQISDDVLVQFLEKKGILCYRGSEKDLLERLLNAATQFKTDIIIDVEGDKIYTDPTYVDRIVNEMQNTDVDYVEGQILNKNSEPVHGIHGFVPAGIRVTALKKICNLKQTKDTETGYKEFFRKAPFIRCKYISVKSKLKFPKTLRLTLDYPEDYNLAKEVFKNLNGGFHLEDVLKLFQDKPELLKITEPILEKWDKYYSENLANLSLKE